MAIVKKRFRLKEVSSNMKQSKSSPCLSNYFNKSWKSAKLAVKSFSMNVQYVFYRMFKNLEFFSVAVLIYTFIRAARLKLVKK